MCQWLCHDGQLASSKLSTMPTLNIALELGRRIDALFEIERGVNGKSADERSIARNEPR